MFFICTCKLNEGLRIKTYTFKKGQSWKSKIFAKGIFSRLLPKISRCPVVIVSTCIEVSYAF